jgi:sucrose-phosphate synthase
MKATDRPLHIVLISIHGLIRGHDLELGRDADTGGQTKYVVELARALADASGVERVDLLTRLVDDPSVSADYAQPLEPLHERANIVRIRCGPPGYLRKEDLWDHLDGFADNALEWLHTLPRRPDLLHSHYADAGYVAGRMARLLAIPLVHTGHSLGRVKRRRLLAAGMPPDEIEARYNIARRIEAEEETLATADAVITSTATEIDDQYGRYDFYQPSRMAVVPPGTDLDRFAPPQGDEWDLPIAQEITRFLREPRKPMILALCRPDERKNLAALVEAYGQSPALRERANLVIVAGNRDDLQDLDDGARGVLTEILLLIDRYDLYGQVAYPKHHEADEVPQVYRLAAATQGVFVNPALTEPFGLTLIEAAASGLPIVATEDGGPTEIVANCHNGILIDPLSTVDIQDALLRLLHDEAYWTACRDQGLAGVRAHYSWTAHAQRYLELVRALLDAARPEAPVTRRRYGGYADRAIFSDLDQNLLGNRESLAVFVRFLWENRKCTSFGLATGRDLESALREIRAHAIPRPDVLITRTGTEIWHGQRLEPDQQWTDHIDHLWQPRSVRRILGQLPGLRTQPAQHQSPFKISWFLDPETAPPLAEIQSLLHQAELSVNLILSFGQFLDVLPVRASKGLALRWVSERLHIPLGRMLVAGGSGADEDMMRGNTLAVVVANRHHEELSQLIDQQRIYFAKAPYAAGIMEAVEHYQFLGECRVPDESAEGNQHAA